MSNPQPAPAPMQLPSRNQPTFLHYTCVFLTMTTLISLVAAYIFYADNEQVSLDELKARKGVESYKADLIRAENDVEALKKLLGYQFSEVGPGEPLNQNTVIGRGRTDIRKHVGRLQDETFHNALLEMSDRLRNARQELDQLKKQQAP